MLRTPSVAHVFCMAADAQVTARVIQYIAIDVIDALAMFSAHDQTVQENRRATTLGYDAVRMSVRMTLHPPSEAINKRTVSLID